jgi:multisubunit Na+/H+ antiporter MnhB subunit
MIEIYALLLFMIAAAIIAVETKDLLSSVISLGAVGFGLTILFLILQAPDLAIVQVVVEILTLVFLIALIFRTTRADTVGKMQYDSTSLFAAGGLIVFLILLAATALYVFRQLPAFGGPLREVADYYVGHGLDRTGAANLVSAILLDFRGYDTLGEATVLFTSVIGVLAVLRKVGRKEKGA